MSFCQPASASQCIVGHTQYEDALIQHWQGYDRALEQQAKMHPLDRFKESRSQRREDFWNVNVPPEAHTKDCPDFLQYAFQNDKDRMILGTLDEDYQRHSWPEVQQLIIDNRLDLFERIPSDLRRYREYCAHLVKRYGSVMNFVVKDRLEWKDMVPSAEPFTNPDDLKILYNDWPYGIDTRIVHLVVWTKFELPAAPVSESNPDGDLTPEARKQINDYVDKTFVATCGRENVIWFKNWASLKSIHAVEHFHVMIFNPDMGFIKRITGGDVPLADKV